MSIPTGTRSRARSSTEAGPHTTALPYGTADLRRRNAELLCDIADLLCDKSDLPRGNANLPGGKLDLPRGRANLLCGNADLLCGNSNLPRGKAGLPRGNVNLLCGNVDLLCGKADLPCVESSRTESGALMRVPAEWKRISDPRHEQGGMIAAQWPPRWSASSAGTVIARPASLPRVCF